MSKQKTAYEMRISEWSSDVCTSDLPGPPLTASLLMIDPTTCQEYRTTAAPASTGQALAGGGGSQAACCRSADHAEGLLVEVEDGFLLLAVARLHLAPADDLAHPLGVDALALGFRVDLYRKSVG